MMLNPFFVVLPKRMYGLNFAIIYSFTYGKYKNRNV